MWLAGGQLGAGLWLLWELGWVLVDLFGIAAACCQTGDSCIDCQVIARFRVRRVRRVRRSALGCGRGMVGTLPRPAGRVPLADKDFGPAFPQVSCVYSSLFLHCLLVDPTGIVC